MSRRSTTLLKTALAAVHYTGAGNLLAPYTRGAGVIFMLHQVDPTPPQAFEPNRILKVTPSFLEDVLREVTDAGFDIVPLDQVRERLENADAEKPFACFTLDDGYRDNRDYAYPIFRRYGAPFTVYVPSDFADGRGDFWWLTFEKVLRAAPHITLSMHGETRHFRLSSPPRRMPRTTRSIGGCDRFRRRRRARSSPSSLALTTSTPPRTRISSCRGTSA